MHTESMAESILCPEPACPAMATIIDHWSWPSTKGPVEHVKTRCPTATSSPQPPTPCRPSSYSSPPRSPPMPSAR